MSESLTGRCQTCRHWSLHTGRFDAETEGENVGDCKSSQFVHEGGKNASADSLRYWASHGDRAGFATGGLFGCVHWSPSKD